GPRNHLGRGAALGEAVVGHPCRRQFLIQPPEEFPFGKHFQDSRRVRLLEDRSELTALLVRTQSLPGVILEGRLQVVLSSFLSCEIKAQSEPQNAVNPERILREAARMKDPEFPPFDIRRAIGRVKKQATRVGMKRNSHGIY